MILVKTNNDIDRFMDSEVDQTWLKQLVPLWGIDQVMQQASKIVLFLADNEQHVFLEGCINCTGSKCCDEDDA